MAESIADMVESKGLGDDEANAQEVVDESGTGENEEPGTSDPDSEGASADPEESGEDETGDGSGEPDEGTKEPDGDPEGYIADEVEVEEPKPEEQVATGEMTPEVKYIVDNLPDLNVRGTSEGKTKTFTVKAAGQLPEDFEFSSKREELLFNQALAGQELRAQQLQTKFQQDQASKQSTEFAEKEQNDIRKDIGDLQREGLIGKFKYQADDPKFDSDPPVKETQEIIDFMNKRNAEYLEQANKGGLYYHMSFRDAFTLMQAQKESKKIDNALDKEDAERKQVTRQNAGSKGAPSNGLTKPRIRANMEDVFAYIDALE
jgi:hypothetical protein